MEDNKNNNIEDDMSMTFVGEIGQKSAIATSDEVESLDSTATSTTPESAFPEVKIDPPTDEAGKTITPDIPSSVPAEEVTNNEPVTDTNNLGNNNQTPSFDNDNKNKNKKGHPVLMTFLLILFLAGGTAFGWYFSGYINKFLNKEETKTEKKETKEVTKVNEEELNPKGTFIKNLVDQYDEYFVSSASIYSVLYAKDKIEIKSLDEDYLRVLAATKATSYKNSFINSEDFQDAVKTLYGSQVTLPDKSFELYKGCLAFDYNEVAKSYVIKKGECGGSGFPTLKRKIIKAVKNESTIEANVAIAVLDTEPTVNKVYKTYDETSSDSNNRGEVVEGVTADTFDIDKDYTKLNQYKYTFNYDKDNNNYYLTTIELIK